MASVGGDGPMRQAGDVVGDWVARFNAGDINGLVALYTPDATLHGTLSPGLAAGREAIEAYFRPVLGAGTQVHLDGVPAAAALAGGAVALAGFYTLSGTGPDGAAFTLQARYTFVLEGPHSGWPIVHQHSSLCPSRG